VDAEPSLYGKALYYIIRWDDLYLTDVAAFHYRRTSPFFAYLSYITYDLQNDVLLYGLIAQPSLDHPKA
jgi:hypothetical protein